MRKKIQQLLLAGLSISLAACASMQPAGSIDLIQLSEQQKSQLNPEGKAMYSYLLGQIAGVHSTLAEQGRDTEKVTAYLGVAVPNLVEASSSLDDLALAEHATKAATFARDFPMALQAAQRWIDLNPKESRAHQYAAIAALHDKQQETALTHFTAVVGLAASADDGLLDVGTLLAREGEKQDALSIAQKIVDTYPDSATALYVQASLQMRFDKKALALSVLDEALAKQPDYRSAKLLKVTVLRSLERSPEALELLENEIARYPEDIEIRSAYAQLLISERRYADAQSQYETLFKSRPNDINMAYRLAMLTLELQQLDLAEKYFMHVLQSGKRSFESLYHLGRIAEQRKEHKKALQYYMRVSEGEYRLDAILREAKMMSILGQLDDGLKIIDKMQSKNTDASLDVRFYMAKIDILIYHDQIQRAYDLTNQALAKYPEDFNVLFTRSMLSEKQGDIARAIKDLEVLVEQQPENPDLLNALGYTLANRTSEYDRAFVLLDKAMRLKPDNSAISDSMGWLLYKQGRLQEAEALIRTAYELDPDPEIAAHLGEILWEKGQVQEAQAVWSKALSEHPEHEVLNQTIQKYQDKK